MYKIGKNPRNKRVLHAVIKYRTLLQLAKGSLIAFRAIAKGYQTPFRDNIACGIRELHASPTMFAIYLWENLIKFLKNVGKF